MIVTRLKPIAVAGAAASLLMLGATPAPAADIKMTPELAKIVAAAKQERVLDISSGPAVNGGAEMGSRIVDGIKKYFGIDIEYKFTPGGPMGEIGNKVATEFRANQTSSTDLWTGAAAQIVPLLRLDMFHKVEWAKLYPERIKPEFVEAEGRALAVTTGMPGILYNKVKAPEFGRVRSMDDLLKPEFKGKFGTTIYGAAFDVMLAKSVWGPDKTLGYYETFVKNAQGILNCGGDDRVASGEFLALAFDCAGGAHHQPQFKNILDLHVVPEMAQRRPYYVMVPKNAAHPNLGILLGLFLSTPEGQKIQEDSWGIPYYGYGETRRHKEIAAIEAKGVKFLDVTIDWWVKHPEIVENSRKMFGIVRANTK
jgi:ABC-type Fe3+ transport system substrate-binding protein